MPTAVPLTQLVDLALGTPEVGAVNFNVLHTLLHAMINKLGIGEVKAEINDYEREFLATVTNPLGPFLQPTSKHTGSDKESTFATPPQPTSVNQRATSAVTSDKDSAKGDDSILDDVSETSFVAKTSTYPQSVPYHRLENRVAELSKALADLNALPTTHELFAEIKGQRASEKPVADMWQAMQLKKRVDANEEGIGKLMLMIDDLMKELALVKEENKALRDSMADVDNLLKRLNELEKLNEALRKDLDDGLRDMNGKIAALPSQDDIAQFVRWADLEDALKGIRTQLENMDQPVPERVVIEMSSQTEKIASRPPSAVSTSSRPGSSRSGPSSELLDILETLGRISDGHNELKKRVDVLEAEMKNKVDMGALDKLSASEDLLNQLNKLRSDVEALQDAVSKLGELSGVDSELRAQMEDLLRKIGEDSDALGRLQRMLKLLEEAIQKLTKTTQDLTDGGHDKDKKIEELFCLCEGLEKKKADKEYVAMEVDVKADKKQLEGKVNHSLFDSTTAEMNKIIRDILDQLAGNSDEWKNMLAKLTQDLDGKLDRLELNPLKEWLEKKLKALSKKIQEGSLRWSDDEAAGLKRQLIQHYHCLSCDKPMDILPTGVIPAPPVNYGLPANRSPRPYTTYELDQIRQHAKSFGSPEQADFYATSRQCGGSHTTTLPHQRFSRLNAFNHLFGREDETEEIVPLHKEEVDVMGADGHIYRGRMQRLEAKMPIRMARSAASNKQNTSESQKFAQRPASARGQRTAPQMPGMSPRSSRPQSARVSLRRGSAEEQSGVTTPAVDPVIDGDEEGEMNMAMDPTEVPSGKGE